MFGDPCRRNAPHPSGTPRPTPGQWPESDTQPDHRRIASPHAATPPTSAPAASPQSQPPSHTLRESSLAHSESDKTPNGNPNHESSIRAVGISQSELAFP